MDGLFDSFLDFFLLSLVISLGYAVYLAWTARFRASRMTIWAVWFVTAFAAFAIIEARAILAKRPTLSRTVWRLQSRFPIFGFVLGVIVGGLAVHFFGFIPACAP